MNKLAANMDHPDRKDQATILLRAVLHALRDRISVSENLHVLAQLPMFLKAVYVEDWSYSDDVDRIKSAEEFTERVKRYQKMYGERRFDWDDSTADLVRKVMEQVGQYLTNGEMDHVKSQLPAEIAALV